MGLVGEAAGQGDLAETILGRDHQGLGALDASRDKKLQEGNPEGLLERALKMALAEAGQLGEMFDADGLGMCCSMCAATRSAAQGGRPPLWM